MVRVSLVFCLALWQTLTSSPAAPTTGWNKNSGTWEYGDSSNWVNGVINGVFDKSLTPGGPVFVQFSGDYSVAGDLSFSLASSSIDFISAGAAKTLSLGGDIHYTPNVTSGNAVLHLGNDVSSLNIDLGGMTRTIEAGPITTALVDQYSGVISNGALIKTGLGELRLRGTNTFSGGIEVRSGWLDVSNAQSAGTGPISITGDAKLSALNGFSNPLTVAANVTFVDNMTVNGTVDLAGGLRTLSLNGRLGIYIYFSSALANGGLNIVGSQNGLNTVALHAASTYGGGTTVQNAALMLDDPASLGTGGLLLKDGTGIGTGVSSVTLPNPVTIAGNLINLNSFGLLELSGPVSIGSQTRTIQLGQGTLILSGGVSGSGGLIVQGVSYERLTLGGVSTFSGGIVLNGAELSFTRHEALGTGPLTLNGGYVIFPSGGNDKVVANPVLMNASMSFQGTGKITGPVTLGSGTIALSTSFDLETFQQGLAFTGNISGPGTLKLKDGDFTLGAANTYTGGTILGEAGQSATVHAGTASAFGSGLVSIEGLGGVGALANLTGVNAITNPFSLKANCSFGSMLEIAGSIDLNGAERVLSTSGTSSNPTILSGVIQSSTGTGALALDGISSTSTMRITGTSTYTGSTTVRGGTILVGGNVAANVAGPFGKAASTIVLGYTSGSTGATLLLDGTFTFSRDLNVQGVRSVTIGVSGPNEAWYMGGIALARALTVSAPSNARAHLSGTISGTGGLTASGPGIISLEGANTYSGATAIRGAILEANNAAGSATGSGNLSIVSGALAGSGTISGAVTVGDGLGTEDSSVSPGEPQSLGTLSIGSLSFATDGVYRFELNSTSLQSDRLSVTGALGLGGSLLSTDLGSTLLPEGIQFVLIENTSAQPTAGSFVNAVEGIPFLIGANQFSITYHGTVGVDGLANDVVLTAIPEPGTTILALCAGPILFCHRRGRRSRRIDWR